MAIARQAKAETTPTGFARGLLIALVAFSFSGAVFFLIDISGDLLYAYYFATLVCTAYCVWRYPSVLPNLKSILPYLGWVIFFFAWGTLVSLGPDLVFSEAVKATARNILFLPAVVAAVMTRRDLRNLSRYVQVAAIANCAISIYEAFNPDLITQIAYSLDPNNTAFDATRPAGLWSNPNEAAFAFILALVLSYWTPGLLGWAGRAASLLGIYLTASRSGFYIVLLLAVLFAVFKLRPWLSRPRALSLLLCIAAFTGWVGLLVVDNWDTIAQNTSLGSNLTRVLDVTESASTAIGQEGRAEIAVAALRADLDAPWFGYGLFTFTGFTDSVALGSPVAVAAHNLYIAVWGEAGVLGIAAYLLVLLVGINRLFYSNLRAEERFMAGLMWIAYLIIGFVWHNQTTSMLAMLYVGLLYHLPDLAPARSEVSKVVPRLEMQRA